jgi:hypothetical protein
MSKQKKSLKRQQNKPQLKVICPYCIKPAKLVDSAVVYFGTSYGMMWLCAPCDAYVGTHKGSKQHLPLGRLANAELRKWKIRAHAAFDPLWKNGEMSRGKAYLLLQDLMGISAGQAHIGEFTVDDCKLLIQKLRERREGHAAPNDVFVPTRITAEQFLSL